MTGTIEGFHWGNLYGFVNCLVVFGPGLNSSNKGFQQTICIAPELQNGSHLTSIILVSLLLCLNWLYYTQSSLGNFENFYLVGH